MADWERLAHELRAIRESAGEHNREEFARKRGLRNSRTVSDLERGVRVNYRPTTLRAAEKWYGLALGNIDQILAGGPIRLANEEPKVSMDLPAKTVGGSMDAVLLDLPESALTGLSEVERQEVRAAAMDAALRRAREIRQQ